MIREILQNVNLFIDGRGQAGQIEEYTLPKISVVMMEIGAGGMGGTIDVPMAQIEKMETEFTLNSVGGDTYKLLTVVNGATIPVTARAVAQDDDGTKHAFVARMRGIVKEPDQGSWKRGGDAKQKVAMTLRSYQLLRDGEELFYADPVNMVMRVNGIDQLALDRAILGV